MSRTLTLQDATERTVGQLAAEQPARSRVFERHGIDYCCGGMRKLDEVCAARGLDTGDVVRELVVSDSTAPRPEVDWTVAGLGDLASHIERIHHAFLKAALPRLTMLTEKVANAHGDSDSRLDEVRRILSNFRAELESHMAKEEMVLFPLCRQLETATDAPHFHCGSIQNPIRVMMAEHEDAGEALEAMRSLTDDYTPPSTACNTYRAMLQALEELEADMHQHVHLENNILFPRAVEAESALAAA